MKRLINLLVIINPTIAAALGIYGGYHYSVAPEDKISAYFGFFVGAEIGIGPVSIISEYDYADFDRNRPDYMRIPEEHPVFGWRCHSLNIGARYRIFRYRVSPYLTTEAGAVWYDYDLSGTGGGWEVPVGNPSFSFSIGGGAKTTIHDGVALFAEVGYQRHFAKILDRYGDLAGDSEYKYSDIEYSGLGIRSGLSIDIL